MKYILLLAFLAPLSLSAQVPADSIWRYAEIRDAVQGALKSKSKVIIDYGEPSDRPARKVDLLTDPVTGKEIKFASMIEAINFMSAQGWELVLSYFTENDAGAGGKIQWLHFVMRRREAR
jgi:hypothetical protein